MFYRVIGIRNHKAVFEWKDKTIERFLILYSLSDTYVSASKIAGEKSEDVEPGD